MARVDLFPDAAHVVALGLGAVDDLDLWAYARDHSYAVVTKDSDFHVISAVRGAPKVVWQRVGNRTVGELERILRESAPDILAFDEDVEAAELTVVR